MAHVYILQSLVNGRYYIGATENLERRLSEHNSGKSTYTKSTKPFKLVFAQNFASTAIAKKIERKIKKLKNRKIIEQIIREKKIKMI